jgi:hypothetical protein
VEKFLEVKIHKNLSFGDAWYWYRQSNLNIGNYITNTRKDKEKIHFLATNTAFQFILQ